MGDVFNIHDFFMDKFELQCPEMLDIIGRELIDRVTRLIDSEYKINPNTRRGKIAHALWTQLLPETMDQIRMMFHVWSQGVEPTLEEEFKTTDCTLLTAIMTAPPPTNKHQLLCTQQNIRKVTQPIYESSISVHMRLKYGEIPANSTKVQHIHCIITSIKKEQSTLQFWKAISNIDYKSERDIKIKLKSMGNYHLRSFFAAYMREYVYFLHCMLVETNAFDKHPLFNDFMNLEAFIIFNGDTYYYMVMKNPSIISKILDHHYMIGTPWDLFLRALTK